MMAAPAELTYPRRADGAYAIAVLFLAYMSPTWIGRSGSGPRVDRMHTAGKTQA